MDGMRPLTIDECDQILELIARGFKYTDKNGANRHFRPNKQVALALELEASLGIRIGDILKLTPGNFKGDKLATKEDKTGKVQYRTINREVSEYVKDYALENGIKPNQELFNITVRAVQKQLKRVTDYLGLDFISTHSFRKMFATEAFKDSGYNLQVVQRLLNHASIKTTEGYIDTMAEQVNATSANMCFIRNRTSKPAITQNIEEDAPAAAAPATEVPPTEEVMPLVKTPSGQVSLF